MVSVPDVRVKKAAKTTTELGEYLDSLFLKWRRGTPGERGSFAEWCRHVKINENLLKSYINRGSRPSDEMVTTLVERFGEIIYEKSDAFPPDPRLRRIAKIWWRVPDAAKEEIAEMADRAAEQRPVESGRSRLEKSK